ncbi:MAG TPA: hypothetical protein VF681_12325 [Abditibacteriaceae bacterium]
MWRFPIRNLVRIFFSAGDVSGDAHCALLMRAIRQQHPTWKFAVVGGAQMQALASEEGDEIVGDTRGLAVMGIAAVYARLPRFMKLFRRTKKWVRKNAIDAAVVCDWGAFHRRLLPFVKEKPTPVLYYFPPRSWRKTGAGASELAPHVDVFATPFEWDAKRLKAHGANAEWVGHPLLEIANAAAPRETVRHEWGVEDNEKLIALLPGSRGMELKYIAPRLAATARLLGSTVEKGRPFKFVVATPAEVALPRVFQNIPNIIHARGRATEALRACDAATVKSGTATLEAAVCDAPQVVVYDGPWIFRLQYLLLLKRGAISFAAMPNLIAEREIVPELLGPAGSAPRLAQAIKKLLTQDTACEMRENYLDVRRALGEGLPQNATQRTVELLETLLTRTVEIDRTP